MLFAWLSVGDSVNVTSVYEMCFSIKQRPARPGMNAVTGTASGAARVPDQDVCVPSRPRRTIPYW